MKIPLPINKITHKIALINIFYFKYLNKLSNQLFGRGFALVKYQFIHVEEKTKY
jgi:hypothetical protein